MTNKFSISVFSFVVLITVIYITFMLYIENIKMMQRSEELHKMDIFVILDRQTVMNLVQQAANDKESRSLFAWNQMDKSIMTKILADDIPGNKTSSTDPTARNQTTLIGVKLLDIEKLLKKAKTCENMMSLVSDLGENDLKEKQVNVLENTEINLQEVTKRFPDAELWLSHTIPKRQDTALVFKAHNETN